MLSKEQVVPPDYSQSLFELGLIGTASAGIQIDVNVATKKLPDDTYVDAPFCDHNCRIFTDDLRTGNYDCPAAITLHPGLKRSSLAPSSLILRAIESSTAAARLANISLLGSSHLQNYFDRFCLPGSIRKVIERHLLGEQIEINLFGGNPELHLDIVLIVSELKKTGHVVNLTTTGGRFLYDPKFLAEVLESPPHLLALSADDFDSPEQVASLCHLDLKDVVRQRQQIPFQFGQRRKALEATYVARLSQIHPGFPQILFNLVVHPGNIDGIEEIIAALRLSFPRALINPYPVQSAFYKGEPNFPPDHLSLLEQFIDNRITDHFHKPAGHVPRLHYWLMLNSSCATFDDNPRAALRALAGYDSWKCYGAPGANRYIQIGASPEVHSGQKIAGGHLACFWNSETVTLKEAQVWDMNPPEIASFITHGMIEIAKSNPDPCPGCNFPRLNFDMVSLENGMDLRLVPAYLDLRRKHLGF